MHQRTIALRSKTEAQDSLRVACQGLDDLLTEVADVDLAEIPQMQSVRRLLLQKARDGYDNLRIRSESLRDPELRWVTARAAGRLGDILEMLGDYEKAEPSYREAIRLLTELITESPNFLPFRRDLVRCDLGLGKLQKKLDRLTEARTNLLVADALRQPLEATHDAVDRKLLAEIDYQMGVLLARETELRGSPPSQSSALGRASQEAYEKAIRTQAALVEERQEGPEQRAKLGRYLNNLGKLQVADHQSEQAEKIFLRVIKIAESEKMPGLRWQGARASYNLGTLRWSMSQQSNEPASRKELAQAALGGIRSAEAALKDLSGDFPEVPQYQAELAVVSSTLGWIEGRESGQAKLESGMELSRQLVDLYPSLPEYRIQYANACRRLSEVLVRIDRVRAESLSREDIRQLEMLAASYSHVPESVTAFLGRGYCQLAAILSNRNEQKEARAAVEKAIVCHQEALKVSPESPKYREWLYNDFGSLSLILLALNDIEGAARAAEELPRLRPDQFNTYRLTVNLLMSCDRATNGRNPDHGNRAVELLREAAQKKLIHDPKQLDLDQFLPLKDRDDFRRLRESLKPPVAG